MLNVTDSDVAMRKPKAEANDMLGDSAIKSYYVNECGKAEMTGDATFQFVTEYKKGTVRDTITGEPAHAHHPTFCCSSDTVFSTTRPPPTPSLAPHRYPHRHSHCHTYRHGRRHPRLLQRTAEPG